MPPEDVNAQAQTAITRRDEQHKEEVQSLTGLVKQRAAEIYNDDRAKEFAGALTSVGERNPKLKQCSTSSILAAMVACVQLDLMPNTSQGLAYLIPYGKDVQFQLGYKGLIELCYRSGEVLAISAELVFPEDEFDFSLGTDRAITHKPDMSRDRTELEEATHVYATATLKNGAPVFDVMSISEIEKIRKNIKAKSTDAPWVTWPEQMAKKTVIKRLTKYLPQSKDDKRLALAVQYDSWAEAGRLSYKDGELIEGKIEHPESEDKPRKQLQAFAKPPEESKTKVEHTVEPTTAPPLPDNSPYPNDPPEKTEEEYRTEVNDMLDFLNLSKREEMRIANECAGTPLIEKAKPEGMKKIHTHLKEIADAKTEMLAEKEE